MRIIIFSFLFSYASCFATDGIIRDGQVTEIRTYESSTNSDYMKQRISINGRALAGPNPIIFSTDKSGAQSPILCKIYTSTKSVMKIALKAKMTGNPVKIHYVDDGRPDGTHCKVRHITLMAE